MAGWCVSRAGTGKIINTILILVINFPFLEYYLLDPSDGNNAPSGHPFAASPFDARLQPPHLNALRALLLPPPPRRDFRGRAFPLFLLSVVAWLPVSTFRRRAIPIQIYLASFHFTTLAKPE